MRLDRNNRLFIYIGLFCLLIFAAGCSKDTASGKISGGRDVMRIPGVTTAGQLDSDNKMQKGVLAVVTAIDTNKQVITLKVIDKRSVELKYSGATDIRGRNNEVISALQLTPGEVVYADYNAGVNKLSGLFISSDEWKEEVSGVNVDTDGSYIEFQKQKYNYDNNLVVVSGTSKCKLEDIEPIDKLLIRGRDKKIDSIVITRGHGYLQLENTGFYEGGIIEVGTEVITGVTKNMKLLVPEGTFRLTVTKGKDSGSKDITIDRNQEQTVNLAEFQKTGERYGSLGFQITPEGANLYIDKKKIDDYSRMVEVKYGEHEIVVTAEGYKTYTTTINVDKVYQPIVIEMEVSEQTTKETETKKEEETTTKKKKDKKEKTTEETTTISFSKIVSDILN